VQAPPPVEEHPGLADPYEEVDLEVLD